MTPDADQSPLAALAGQLFDQPLLMEQTRLNALLHTLGSGLGFRPPAGSHELAQAIPEAGSHALPERAVIQTAAGQLEARRADQGHWILENGIAVIPCMGVLVNRGPSWGRWLTSYQSINRQLDAIEADTNVNSFLMDVDSGGGLVAGCFDTCDRIRQVSETKPSLAVANEVSASAAYALASACSEVAVARTGYCGSIGVVTAHVDYSKAMDEFGIAVTFIHAGDKKVDGNAYQPLSDRARNDLQASIDTLYALFCDTVAKHRGMKVEAVRATEAGMYLGRDAVSAGLANRVNSFSNELSNLAIRPVGPQRLSTQTKEHTMSDETEKAAAKAAADQDLAHAQEQGKAAGQQAGANAERERISGILGSDAAKGRKGLAEHFAFNTNMSVEDATAALAAAPQEQAAGGGNPLGVAMNNLRGTGVKPDRTDDAGAAAEAEAKVAADLDSTAIYGRLNKALGSTAALH